MNTNVILDPGQCRGTLNPGQRSDRGNEVNAFIRMKACATCSLVPPLLAAGHLARFVVKRKNLNKINAEILRPDSGPRRMPGGECRRLRGLRMTGFTFIELIVVIALIALGAAILLPMYNSYMVGNNLRQAANLLATDLRRTEEEARRVGIACKPATCVPPCPVGCAGINRRDVPGALVGMTTLGAVVFSNRLPLNVALTADPVRLSALVNCVGAAALQFPGGTGLVFNPQGNPVSCAGLPMAAVVETLTLSDTRGNRFIITLDLRTGIVSGP